MKHKMNHPSAIQQCRIEGDRSGRKGMLAEARTESQYQFMQDYFISGDASAEVPKSPAWVGGKSLGPDKPRETRASRRERFYWQSDNSSVDPKYWRSDQPDITGEAACMTLNSRDRRGFEYCHQRKYPFCAFCKSTSHKSFSLSDTQLIGSIKKECSKFLCILVAPSCDSNPENVIGIGGGTLKKTFTQSENSLVEVSCPDGYTGTVTVKCVKDDYGKHKWQPTSGVCTGMLI